MASTQDYKTVGGKKLPASAFAYVGDLKDISTWHLPLDVSGRVDAAMSRFNQTEGIPSGKKKAVARKIASKARKLGIDPSGFEKKYVKEACSLDLVGTGPYLDVHQRSIARFEAFGYPPQDAAALSHLIVARQLREALASPPAQLNEWMFGAERYWGSGSDDWDQTCREVTAVACYGTWNDNPPCSGQPGCSNYVPAVFDSSLGSCEVQGVYPPIGINPGLVVVRQGNNSTLRAADWEWTAEGCAVTNPRTITPLFPLMSEQLSQTLGEGMHALYHLAVLPLDTEIRFLVKTFSEQSIILPAIKRRFPLPPGPLLPYLEAAGLLSEDAERIELPEREFRPTLERGQVIVHLSRALDSKQQLERQAVNRKLQLVQPVLGMPMSGNGAEGIVEQLCFDRARFSAEESFLWCITHGFGNQTIEERPVDYRARLRSAQSAATTRLPLLPGIDAVVCYEVLP